MAGAKLGTEIDRYVLDRYRCHACGHTFSIVNGQAYRLVNTRALDRGAWLAIRRGGIGGSDAAAAVGLHPYQSALELWMDKTGRQSASEANSEPTEPNSPTFWGQLLEPTVAEAYAQITDRKVRRVNAILQHPAEMRTQLHWTPALRGA